MTDLEGGQPTRDEVDAESGPCYTIDRAMGVFVPRLRTAIEREQAPLGCSLETGQDPDQWATVTIELGLGSSTAIVPSPRGAHLTDDDEEVPSKLLPDRSGGALRGRDRGPSVALASGNCDGSIRVE